MLLLTQSKKDSKMYAAMQNIILMSVQGMNVEEVIEKIVFSDNENEVSFATLYKEDINMELLVCQLPMMFLFFFIFVFIFFIYAFLSRDDNNPRRVN